uniref:Uncharacterized protein n=1 Tax=Gopherus agassizii TaxID=38772 RepID=A0A452IJP1_9SAUR
MKLSNPVRVEDLIHAGTASTDINTLLALVEDIICQQNRAGQEFYDESKKKDDSIIITLGSVDIQEKTRSPTPEKGMGERLKHNDYNRYLYMQLQHVEMELELLGPHKFQKAQSYIQAVRQVQHMKGCSTQDGTDVLQFP